MFEERSEPDRNPSCAHTEKAAKLNISFGLLIFIPIP
jgi:hypothetical protein